MKTSKFLVLVAMVSTFQMVSLFGVLFYTRITMPNFHKQEMYDLNVSFDSLDHINMAAKNFYKFLTYKSQNGDYAINLAEKYRTITLHNLKIAGLNISKRFDDSQQAIKQKKIDQIAYHIVQFDDFFPDITSETFHDAAHEIEILLGEIKASEGNAILDSFNNTGSVIYSRLSFMWGFVVLFSLFFYLYICYLLIKISKETSKKERQFAKSVICWQTAQRNTLSEMGALSSIFVHRISNALELAVHGDQEAAIHKIKEAVKNYSGFVRQISTKFVKENDISIVDFLEDFKSEFTDQDIKRITLSCEVPHDCTGPILPLSPILSELVNNALKYSAPDTRILVSVEKENKELCFSVQNYVEATSKVDFSLPSADDVDHTNSVLGLGLLSITLLARALGWQFSITRDKDCVRSVLIIPQ